MKVKQHDITDCGAACLASIAGHYGLKMPIARIRQIASTDQKGTNILGLIEAAQQLGFAAKGVKTSIVNGEKDTTPLEKIPKPAIAHVVVKDVLHHFVVIYKADGKQVTVMDPADGKMHCYSYDTFCHMWTGMLILLVPQDDFKTGNEKVSISKRFWYLLRPHGGELVQAIFGAIVFTVLGLATSVFVQKIVDNVIPEGNGRLLNLLSVVMIVILFLSVFISYFKTLFVIRIGQKIDARLILGYYKHLLRLPQSFFDNMRTGEIISRINDAVKIRVFINDTMINLLVSLFMLVFAFVLMFTYYWKLALILLAIIPLYAMIYVLFNYANRRTQRKLMEHSADLEAQLVESINTAGTIKRFGMESFAGMKTETRFVRLLTTIYTSGKTALWASSATDFISRLFVIILLWCGTYFVLRNQITPGELLSFYALIGYFTGPIASLIGMNRSLQDARIAADRLFEIMDLEREDEQKKIPFSKEQVGDIVFENVSFRYGSRTTVFQNLNLQLSKGKISAVVGESGSGKTTLLSILQNLYPLQGGSVTIGGVDVRHIDSSSLRQLVSVVPQQIDLFEGSLIDNIALGDFSVDYQQVLSICGAIGLLPFIQSLPQGFHTNIGENGVKLSGGQRQRIAIARALYRKPEILILDEATSALDSESEQNIKASIDQLRSEGKTIIVIAHRLGTVTGADCIYMLHQGSLEAKGTHEELLAGNERYARYWKAQTQLA